MIQPTEAQIAAARHAILRTQMAMEGMDEDDYDLASALSPIDDAEIDEFLTAVLTEEDGDQIFDLYTAAARFIAVVVLNAGDMPPAVSALAA